MKRLALATGLVLATTNVWTGAPLLAVWVGARVQGGGAPSMGAVAVVAVVLAVLCFALVRVIARLSAAYDAASGRPAQVRQHVPWLRSMRGERPTHTRVEATMTVPEYVLVGSVAVAVLVFEVWFFFYSGSPIQGSTGR